MKIEGKCFVVTGGASGLGEGTTREIVSRGGKVAIFDMNKEKADAVVAELGADACAFYHCNIMEEESIDSAIEAAHAHFGELHGAVLCAGGALGAGLTVGRNKEGTKLDTWWKTVRLNIFGTFAVGSKVAAVCAKQGDAGDDGEKGVLVQCASIAAVDGQDGQSAYSAGKAGVVGMTLPMARDLSRVGVRVCTIMPGTMGTPMTAPIQKEGNKVGDSLRAAVPFPSRFGYPQEFAGLACHIIENGFLNGTFQTMHD